MAITNSVAEFKSRKLMWLLASIVVASSAVRPVQAVSIHVDAQATYTGTIANVLTLIPLNTTVTASVDFDLGPGDPDPAPSISSASGTFSWDNGGPQVYNVSGAAITGAVNTGIMTFDFSGTGPTIGGVTPDPFMIRFDIGTNPFTTTAELSDLMLNQATVFDMRVGARTGSSTIVDDIDGNVSGTISQGTTTIPLPAAAWMTLPLISLLGAGQYIKRRRAA